MGKISYCLIDATDPTEEFECEGKAIKSFFGTVPLFRNSDNLALIQTRSNLADEIKDSRYNFYNIFHIAAHGKYLRKTKNRLDYTYIYQKLGRIDKEFFRPESIVRLGIQADVLFLTSCESFNSSFIEILSGYRQINNFIAPKDSPLIGDTIIFSLMFYNKLIRRISRNQRRIGDSAVLESFKITNRAYKAYKGQGNFALINFKTRKTYK